MTNPHNGLDSHFHDATMLLGMAPASSLSHGQIPLKTLPGLVIPAPAGSHEYSSLYSVQHQAERIPAHIMMTFLSVHRTLPHERAYLRLSTWGSPSL